MAAVGESVYLDILVWSAPILFGPQPCETSQEFTPNDSFALSAPSLCVSGRRMWVCLCAGAGGMCARVCVCVKGYAFLFCSTWVSYVCVCVCVCVWARAC